jgi:hypothetical protein
MFFGFAAAVVLALGPPIAFLMVPAAGFFLWVVPIWSIGAVCVLFFVFSMLGRNPAVIGVGLLVIAVAVSPIGRASIALVNQVDQHANDNDLLRRKMKECTTTGYTLLKKPSARYDLLVLDNIEACGAENYDIADTVAILTGMRVVEIGRVCFHSHRSEFRETMAEHSNACVGERDSVKVGVTPQLLSRKVAPLDVDVCLIRRKIPDPSGDRTPAIVLRSIPFGGGCQVTEVVERTAGGEVELGRVHYLDERFYPDLAVPEGVPRNNWLTVILSTVLQQDLSDKALMGHAVEVKK